MRSTDAVGAAFADEGDQDSPGGGLLSRRALVAGGLALGVSSALSLRHSRTGVAATAYDPRQRFVQLIGGGNGVIYAIQADGRLLWYRHKGWSTATASWARGGTGRQIGTEWTQFRSVMADGDGTIFALRGNGDLLWYRYILTDLETGAGYWAARSGSRIGHGFDVFPRIFGGFDRMIWGINGTGDLYWYRYLRNDGIAGSGAWAGGTRVGTGWNRIGDVVADTAGVVYGIAGTLLWYRFIDGGAGNRYWQSSAGRAIGSGWSGSTQKAVFCAGSGALYRVALDGGPTPDLDDRLIAYRLTNWTTAGTQGAAWVNSGRGVVVGQGFTVESSAAMQAYSSRVDVRRGGRAGLALSTTFPSVTVSVLRLAPGQSTVQVRSPVTVPGALRSLPSGYRATGCEWPESVAFDVPQDWPSGLYTAQLQGPHSLRRYVPFVVRPAQPSASIAVLLPTNTYRAYDPWGGHNQYSVGEDGRRRTISLLKPYAYAPVTAPGRLCHTWYSDLLLLRWMSARGISYDVFEDPDLHVSGGWLLNYQTLVLTTHPEYWSETMRENLIGWLGTGGRLIYTGGNGIFERVNFDPQRATLTFRRSNGSRDYFREAGLPESQILGVAYDFQTHGTFGAYQVKRDHPLFAGTGLSVGDTFGQSGFNGAASGWEVDARLGLDGDAADHEVIAEGIHSRRSSMVFMERSNGGFVFSAGSLTFNGALASDARLSRLLANVFDRALAENRQQLAVPPATATPEPTTPTEVLGEERAVP